MVTKRYCFRANSLPFAIFPYPVHFVRKHSSSPNTLILRLFSSSAIKPTIASCKDHLSRKGKSPFQEDLKWTQIDRLSEEEEMGRDSDELNAKSALDEDEFAKIYEILAIRFPAKDCFALESRLRGHLLNWPRIRNIARVGGDEVEDDAVKLLAIRRKMKKKTKTASSIR